MTSKLLGTPVPTPNLFQCSLEKFIKIVPNDQRHNDWAKAAVMQLKKKIKEDTNPDLLEDLLEALRNPNRPSKCIPISRNQDGRMQVKNLKRYPHFIFCVIWRWPHLESHTLLKEVKDCRFPFSKKDLKHVCVNPHHYELVGKFSPVPAPIKALEPPNGAIPPGTPPGPYQPIQGEKSRDREESAPLPAVWGTIRYYERSTRIGDSFPCFHEVVTVDGFTDPSNNGDRFSLGTLSNPSRGPASGKARRAVVSGIRLLHHGNKFFVENISTHPVFVNSRLSNLDNEDPSPGRVERIAPGESWEFFDMEGFRSVLQSRASRGSYMEVHDLGNMCSIPFSFGKGWGGDYRRKEVSQTPCWIEVLLHEPLKWMDEVLKVIEPDTFMSSNS